MASFKMMSSSNSRNSDLSRRNSSSSSSSPSIRSHHLRRDPHADHSILTFGYGGGNDMHDYTFSSNPNPLDLNGDRNSVNGGRKSVDDVWKEIISGEKQKKQTIIKEEAQEEVLMTLEDFLARVAANEEDSDVKIPPEKLNNNGYTFNYPMMVQNNNTQFQMLEGSVSGEMRGKRGRLMMDKDAAQRQKRMIKNRESAARSREKKQAYQLKLETLAAKLEEENEQLLKEVQEMSKERYKKLMEPVEEKRKQSSLTRSFSLEW